MLIMCSLASLPLIYVYSFSPKSELLGFIGFFVVNVIGCFFDMILNFISIFSQAQAVAATSATKLSIIMVNLTWVLAVLFPTVNFKHALFNIRLKSNPDCISSLNSLFFTNYNTDEGWMSILSPGLGAAFLIFWAQIIFWWTILILIENSTNIKLGCRRCCKREQDLQKIDEKKQRKRPNNRLPPITSQWTDEEIQPPVLSSWDDAVN